MRAVHKSLATVIMIGLVAYLAPVPQGAWAQRTRKIIKFGVNRAAEDLDPITQDGNPNIWAFMQIYQPLVRVNVKGDGFDPDLAERWTVSADGKTWTFFLRKDAHFSTGDPVKASDVVWSLKRAHDSRAPGSGRSNPSRISWPRTTRRW